MRAIEPTGRGQLHLHGFRAGYETFGDPANPTVLLLPTWQIVHSRIWKMQIPFLARHFQVVTFDSPGNGLGERTTDPAAFQYERIVRQVVGVLDHLDIQRASVVGFSRGCDYGILLAATEPGRVERLILLGNGVSRAGWQPQPAVGFWDRRETYEGWQKRNAHYFLEQYDDWLSFFFSQIFPEPHSSKPIDDGSDWARETTPEVLVSTVPDPDLLPHIPAAEAVKRIQCPVLLVHGDDDRCDPIEASYDLVAARPEWELVVLEGSGHGSLVRHPVQINLEVARFLGLPLLHQRVWTRASARPRRALFISSPIGLGHVQRDLAIARELRRLVPDLEIDWLAQPPVTDVLERVGETIHPLSRELASESAHWEAAAGEHQLHCFHAFREMDEILLANFMVFLHAVRQTSYDLWIGDEAWDVDYYLHENPELKTTPYVFMTDFLGWLPVDDDPGSREAFLTADYNAEMIGQIERFPYVRDRALYFGEYDDLVPDRFGPDLPVIRDWAREHFSAVGYVVPFNPADFADTGEARERLGYDPEQPLIIAAAGGTRVGRHLLGKIVESWPLIRREQPDARCVVVAGPRIDPASIPEQPGMEVRPYIHNLYKHLAVADLGIVQGGLSTTMELAVNRRPFLYFPLRDHCEQVFHVAQRLVRYRAGRRLDYEIATPRSLAQAALATLGSDTTGSRQHEPGAAHRAATLIAEIIGR